MASFLDYICRWMLALLLVFEAVQQSESFTWTRRPQNPTVVVEGVNSSRVSLAWEFTASSSNYNVSLSRQRPSDTTSTQIASRTDSTAFEFTNQSFRTKYEPRLPAYLVLKDVKRNEEYVYTITVQSNLGVQKVLDQVTIDVLVPPKITIAPVREPQLSIGQNYTLTCNASGDPQPGISWTKDGVPANQFYVSGPLLHLVNVQRKDAGSYRCTAYNGYGDDATGVSIVGIKCTDCQTKIVAITLRSEYWKPAYSNQASIEFKYLESKLLSAISAVYTKNPAKQLYRLDVYDFRPGSVVAIVKLLFGKSANDPLKPLQDEIKDGKLGSFAVEQELHLKPDPTNLTITVMSSTNPTTADTSAVTDASWMKQRIICAFYLITVIVLLV